MTLVIAEHPLIDAAGSGWVATETRAEVVALTPGMSDFLHRAATENARPIVVSGEHSRMTQPLSEALAAVGGGWVVRTTDAGLYDARTGAALTEPAAVLTASTRSGATDPHPAFVRATISSALRLVATVSTRHRVSRPIRLGGVAELAAERFADESPRAWGPTEPLVAPWDRDDLTERTRRRMPSDGRWAVVAGARHPFLGTLHVARTAEGLEETTRVWAAVGAPGDPRVAAIDADARAFLTDAAGVGMPLLGLAFASVGAPDLTRRSSAELRPEPLALLIGPPGVRALGVDPHAWAGTHGGELVGSPRLPGVLLRLGSLGGGGWERLAAVLGSVDADRLTGLLGVAPAVARALRDEGEG